MRVISGKIRGKKLYSLQGDNTRPTTDRVKENIFNMIAGYVQGAVVLDLFAGSGALGIEALSRGGAYCDFVENNLSAMAIIKKNLGEMPFGEDAVCTHCYFSAFLEKTLKRYDIIFLDPPYSRGYYEKALSLIKKRGILNDDGIIVLEKDAADKEEYPFFETLKERRYGHTSVSILQMIGE